MISLLVKDYCHDCPEFEADVEKLNFVTNDLCRYDTENILTNTHIGCKHRVRCAGMVEYLKEQAKKSKEDTK